MADDPTWLESGEALHTCARCTQPVTLAENREGTTMYLDANDQGTVGVVRRRDRPPLVTRWRGGRRYSFHRRWCK